MIDRDLFEDLRIRVQCTYISDLRFNPWLKKARKEIMGMKLDIYGLNALNDAADYLYGVQKTFACVEEATAFFIENQKVG